MIKNSDFLFKKITEKAAAVDFTGYTVQYPPMLFWKKINQDEEREIRKSWEKRARKNLKRVGLYIHIPFCNQRCSYCRYFSKGKVSKSLIEKYLRFLEKEVRIYRNILGKISFRTLYIGGGTPSILSKNQLDKLFRVIYSNFNFRNCIQVAFEANPDSLSYQKLKLLKQHKVNRLTIGVQTLDDKVLKAVNRIQDKKSVYDSYRDARKVGISWINVDLMAGLPLQNVESFRESLEEIIKLRPDMVHIHPFYPTPYTQFEKKGGYLSPENVHLRSQMVFLGNKILTEAGYKEIKFDAAGLNPQARNIQLSDAIEYNSPFLGLGAGAASHLTYFFRYVNYDNLRDYFNSLKRNILPIYLGYKLSKKDEMVYYVTANLRYREVSKRNFRKLFKKNIEDIFSQEINYLIKRGKIIDKEDKILLKSGSLGEYAIYSKYFYDKELIENCKKLFKIDKSSRLKKEEIECLEI
ncbi:MAG: hypothetical protein DRH33_06770 [Candidatus Nealsonbacteria bacterium]|nr:MAG: hypothetical protein DRH33_06770 [Candidatus Nealsonbacteria bacterium]